MSPSPHEVGRDGFQAQAIADGFRHIGFVLDDQHTHALDVTSGHISSAYQNPHTRRQHRATVYQCIATAFNEHPGKAFGGRDLHEHHDLPIDEPSVNVTLEGAVGADGEEARQAMPTGSPAVFQTRRQTSGSAARSVRGRSRAGGGQAADVAEGCDLFP